MLRAVVVQLYNLPNLYRVNHVVLRPTLTHTVRVPPPLIRSELYLLICQLSVWLRATPRKLRPHIEGTISYY